MKRHETNLATSSVSSEQSGNTQERKKKGLKKLRSSISGAFGGKKRRRRKKSGSQSGSQGGSVDGDSASYDSYSAASERSSDSLLRNSANRATPTTSAQQEWINGGASGLEEMAAISNGQGRYNSAGGRGASLMKIAELPEEDDGSVDNIPTSRNQHNSASKRKNSRSKSGDSVHSRDSKRSIGSYFGRKEKPQADPLSLVVLLVEPSSLRFELLSLDFDLTTKKSRRSRKRNSGGQKGSAPPELQLTVQDVLDQITPEALTDETLKKKAAIPGACHGLIDRTGKIHFGGASLEAACASRPLRSFDTALLKQKNNAPTDRVLLSVPTYGGEPHKDVLLGFFGEATQNDEVVAGVLSEETKDAVSNALELARPIFADPNVIELMEASGYNLKGWKSEKKPETKLGKPLPPPTREPKTSSKSAMGKLLLAFLVVLFATVLAWSIVAGGLHYLPSIEAIGSNHDDGPSTLEGHVLYVYEFAKEWYKNQVSSSA